MTTLADWTFVNKTAAADVPQIRQWVDEWETDDYPYGRFRTTARWWVDKKGNKARVGRTTVNPKNGRVNKPKYTTYGAAAKLGVGADGRVYIFVGGPGQIRVMGGDMKYSLGSVFTDDPRYAEFAKRLKIKTVDSPSGGTAQVKKVQNGALIDGLQGTSMRLRELLDLAGLKSRDQADIDKVKRKDTITHTLWTVIFKSDRPDYTIQVKT